MAVSLIVLRELLSSLPAATWASRVHPVGMFLEPSGKKLIVRAGQAAAAAAARCAEPAEGGKSWRGMF